MRSIYYYECTTIINGYKATGYDCSTWHYGILPTVKQETFDDFDEAINSNHFTTFPRLFSNDLVLTVDCDTYITRKKFKEASFLTRPCPINGYTVKQLSEHLPANEFIQWCKDNGLTAIY